MDNFHSQSGPMHLKEGHEESDISVRGIILSGAALAVSGVFAFVLVLGFYRGIESYWRKHDSQLTPVEEQLQSEREALARTQSKTPLPPEDTNQLKPLPDWYGRGKIDEHLARTFPGPRLQYDDVYDMSIFRTSEEQWLDSAGKDANGNVHIPVSRAMELMAQRGLPQVSGPFLPNNLPSAVPLVPAGPSRR